MPFTCDSCRTRQSGTPRTTVTGRELCESCDDSLLGAAAGYVAGGSVESGIATAGWFSRLRERRRKDG